MVNGGELALGGEETGDLAVGRKSQEREKKREQPAKGKSFGLKLRRRKLDQTGKRVEVKTFTMKKFSEQGEMCQNFRWVRS